MGDANGYKLLEAAYDDDELVDDLGVTCWLLKDAGWVLLCPYVSVPASISALAMECRVLVSRWPRMGMPQQMHGLAVFLWLLGNSVWMFGELFFEKSDEPGRTFPWFSGPVLGVHSGVSAATLLAAQCLFLSAFAAVLRCYIWYVAELLRNSSAERLPEVAAGDRKVFGVIEPDVYETMFIGPWVLKDLFWTIDRLCPALVCSGATMALIVHSGMHTGWRAGYGRSCSELLWMTGNTVWLIAELASGDSSTWAREVACVVLLTGCVPLVCAVCRSASGKAAEEPHESTGLLAKSGT